MIIDDDVTTSSSLALVMFVLGSHFIRWDLLGTVHCQVGSTRYSALTAKKNCAARAARQIIQFSEQFH
jgi:hypothetical protein